MASESHGAAAAEAASAGLPQFDPTYFASQVFWLAIVFGLLYLLLSQALLPKLGGVIQARATKLQGDIDAAAKANAEAQDALAGYEKALAGARHQARVAADAARADAAASRAKASAAAEAQLAGRLSAAEDRLAAERSQSLAAARDAAADVAREIVAKVAGVEISAEKARTLAGAAS